MLWALLLAGLAASLWVTGLGQEEMTWSYAWEFVRGMFPPDWSVTPRVLMAMAETIGIAFLGTFLAFLAAFPISFLMARNVGHPLVGSLLRGLMSFLRAVPEVVWAIVFVVALGFGNGAGALALAAHNIGILSKLFSEVYETAPIGTQEAMAATGSGTATAVWFGIIPWSVPGLMSHAFFRFECNIRTAAILGVVGAGGIGKLLMIHRSLFQYNALLVDTIGMLALVVLSDWLGSMVRKQVI